jgi:hypothetical protein
VDDGRQHGGGWARRLAGVAAAAPAFAVVVALVALTVHCQGLLAAAAAGDANAAAGPMTWLVVAGFVAACGAAVAWHCARLARRVAGPEWRLCRALQRVRAGGSGERVRLRRGDLLTGLAAECNELLAWAAARQQGVAAGDRADAPAPAEARR